MPQLENALLAGHDMIFLGERGQAKTRMIRSLTGLLDEWMPIVAGTEINDDPYRPVSKYARDLVAAQGDDTPDRRGSTASERFGEKLATPDMSIADLIGEVDPIKVAEGRYLSDELTMHYGLVPRTNRGIFAINELPDLAERIQVGLFNVLEERDVQIRGYPIRLPLDVCCVASANPEDYTNRGRIITPLKDRFGSQIRTHYPLDVATEVAIMRQEAPARRVDGSADRRTISVPDYLTDVIATFSHLARASNQVNQRSGVSVRLSVSNYETLAANALRRGLRAGERTIVPASTTSTRSPPARWARSRSSRSKKVATGRSWSTSSRVRCSPCSRTWCHPNTPVRWSTRSRRAWSLTPAKACTSEVLARLVDEVHALRGPVAALTGGDESPAAVARRSSSCWKVSTCASGSTRTERRERHLPLPYLTTSVQTGVERQRCDSVTRFR